MFFIPGCHLAAGVLTNKTYQGTAQSDAYGQSDFFITSSLPSFALTPAGMNTTSEGPHFSVSKRALCMQSVFCHFRIKELFSSLRRDGQPNSRWYCMAPTDRLNTEEDCGSFCSRCIRRRIVSASKQSLVKY